MKEKNVGVYKSFEELRDKFGLKPIIKQTKDKSKLENQRNSFSSKHVCPSCGKPLIYIDGTNVMVCKTDGCKGIKHEVKNDETGETKVWYETSYHSLDDTGAKIASNIFKD